MTLTAAAALLAVDVVGLHHLPTLRTVVAPFNVYGRADTLTVGPALQATVDGVEISSTAVDPTDSHRTPMPALGRWVVVHAETIATSKPVLPRVYLVMGADRYLPSSQFDSRVGVGQLVPGIWQTGSWVFDVATELVEPNAPKRFQLLLSSSGFLGDQLVIDLGGLTPARPDVIELHRSSARAQ